MPGPDVAYFRARYSAMDAEELATMYRRAQRQPEQLTDEAHEALRYVVEDRGLDVNEVLREKAKAHLGDLARETEMDKLMAAREKRQSRVLGKVLGLSGVAIAIVVLIQSLLQGHAGGVAAAVATAVCSLWLVLRYRGD